MLTACATNRNIETADTARVSAVFIDTLRVRDTLRITEYSVDSTHYIVSERVTHNERIVLDTVVRYRNIVQHDTSEDEKPKTDWQLLFACVALLVLVCALFIAKK